MIKKDSFTLAEVLIVLVIIGVIAAITIPSLMQNINDQQYKTMWKKEFSTMNQAFNLMVNADGSPKGLCNDWDYNCFTNYFGAALKSIKNCAAGDIIGKCWDKNDGSSHLLNGDSITWWPTDAAGLVLPDGTLLSITYAKSDCSYTDLTSADLPVCGYLYVDVNGFNPPNILGKDIYAAWILPNRIVPFGYEGDGHSNQCDKNASGWSCSSDSLYK